MIDFLFAVWNSCYKMLMADVSLFLDNYLIICITLGLGSCSRDSIKTWELSVRAWSYLKFCLKTEMWVLGILNRPDNTSALSPFLTKYVVFCSFIFNNKWRKSRNCETETMTFAKWLLLFQINLSLKYFITCSWNWRIHT